MTGRYREWRNMLKKAVLDFLGPDYVLVSHCHLVGVCCLAFISNLFSSSSFGLARPCSNSLSVCIYQIASDLFARRVIADRIKDLAVTTVKTGFDSSYGNKVSLHVGSTSEVSLRR